ncbi:MAG: hypothetical protein K5799_04105 [Erythrobacter sp.]|nr:hypothetical protein [Erythrobacter sp.]
MEDRNGDAIFEMSEPDQSVESCLRMAASLRTVLLACACCASLAACDISDHRDSAAEISGKQQLRLLTSLHEIEGFWLIERFNDFKPSWRNNTPWRSAYVQIDDNNITYKVSCNQSGNSASLGRNGILHDTSDGSRLQTMQGCGPDREARDKRFFAFFGSKPEVRRMGRGRVSLKSEAGELVLIDPELWRQEHKPDLREIEGRWVPQMSTSYDGWGSSGFGIGDSPGVVTIGRERLLWSRCPDLPIPIRWTADARLELTDEIDVSECPVVTRTATNGPGAIMAFLTADPAVIRTGADRIVLVDGTGEKGRQMNFRSEESILNPAPPPPMPEGYDPPPPPPSPPGSSR